MSIGNVKEAIKIDGHSVKIVHGYGDVLSIQLDGRELKQVKSYCVKGVPGTIPELTVTMDINSVIYETKGKQEKEEG